MSIQRSSKPPNLSNQNVSSRSSSVSSSVSSHLAMIELKQRILTSLSKLSDRDTQQIAVEDLEEIIEAISNDGVSMLLNCLCDATNDPKPAVKKESIRLLAVLCSTRTDSSATHLTKIIAHVVKRLKDSDSQVRDACCDAIGSLSALYLKGVAGGGDGVVSLFVKPLFEVISENNKAAQGGAAMCIAKMVECASEPPLTAFQKLCSRICKLFNNQHFMAKASLLHVVSSLLQIGAIPPQSSGPLLQSIHECLGSSDWTTRKAAADTLCVLALHPSNITTEGAASTLTVLEACRFDKIKPARESMMEALLLWKKIAGKDGSSDGHHDGEASELANSSDKKNFTNPDEIDSEKSTKNSSSGSSPTDSISKGKWSYSLDKAVGILKRRAPGLTDKELNPEFFQKLETRGSDDLPVEVILPRRCLNTSNSQNGEVPEPNDTMKTRVNGQQSDGSLKLKNRNMDRGTRGEIFRDWYRDYRSDSNKRESSTILPDFSKNPNQTEGFVNIKGSWLAIQSQLVHLERQQSHLMNMLQDFMGGSHDSMVTLENRVRGLERVVEDMARDFSISTGRRGGSTIVGFEGCTNGPTGKYNDFPDYSNGMLGKGNDGPITSGIRGRGPSWRSNAPYSWDFHSYSKNGQVGSRRPGNPANMPITSENETHQVGSRKGWDKGTRPVRFGEEPSARSVWQASKDESTLEAIRVAGEDNGPGRSARSLIPEMTSEAPGDDRTMPQQDPTLTSWSNTMESVRVGDFDSAFAEILSNGDEFFLVKLMERSGPVIDQLSNEVAGELLHAVAQLVLDQNLFDLCLHWLEQLLGIVMENGPDVLRIPIEVKREILLNLHESSSSLDLPEEWEGAAPEQLLLQLASAWAIDLQHLVK